MNYDTGCTSTGSRSVALEEVWKCVFCLSIWTWVGLIHGLWSVGLQHRTQPMSSHKPANVLRNRAVTRENFTLFSVLYCTEMCTRFHSNCSDSSPRCRRTDHSIVFATWLQRVPWAHAILPQTSPLVHPFCQAHWCARQKETDHAPVTTSAAVARTSCYACDTPIQ